MAEQPSNDLDLLTPEKAAFIEQKTREHFDFVIQAFDLARSEGRTMLQWLFAVIVGGMGLTGTLAQKGYWPLGLGSLAAAGWAAWVAHRLIRQLKSQEVMPPGNLAKNLRSLIDVPECRMRWWEAYAMDERIAANKALVQATALAVDAARDAFSLLPLWFIGGIVSGYAAWGLWLGAFWLFR